MRGDVDRKCPLLEIGFAESDAEAASPSANSNLPRPAPVAPVNAPFFMTEQPLSINSARIAAQFTFTNGPAATGCSDGYARRAVPCPDRIRRSTIRAHPTALPYWPARRHADPAGLAPIILALVPTISRRRSFSARKLESLQRVLHRQQHPIAAEQLLQKIECAGARGFRPLAGAASGYAATSM